MEPTHQRSTMKRKLEIDEGALISYEMSMQTCVTAAADIAKYLDPPCILHFMNVHASLQKTLSRFYCTKHGFEFLTEGGGLCQEDVEEQIQRDGHNIQLFREKLAARTDLVNPRIGIVIFHCHNMGQKCHWTAIPSIVSTFAC